MKIHGLIKFNEFVEDVYFPLKKQQIKETTLMNYKITLGNIKHLKDKNLLFISEKDILTELSLWKESYRREILKILNPIFKLAIAKKYKFSNPCKNIKISMNKRKIEFFKKDELVLILDKVKEKNKKLYVAILLALYGGLRRGEIAGLRIKDIDFKKGTININQQIITPPYGTSRVSGLKTKNSYRTISLNKFILDEIKKLNCNEYAIPGHSKEFLVPAWITSNFTELQKDLGLKPKRFHDLRVTHTTYLISQGVDIKTVSRRLGHSNTNITMEIYTAYMQEKDIECVEVMEKYLTKVVI